MPLSIAFLSKYPPLEGGIAAKTCWLARGLASRGHRIHVITDNLSVGGEYRIEDCAGFSDEMADVTVHRPAGDIPWHIPESQERTLSLLDLTLQVIRQFKVDILDTGYLIPYGVVGDLAKRVTGVRHVLRHGGSDLEKFLKRGVLGAVLGEAIGHADVVVTDKQHATLFLSTGSCLVLQFPYVPDDVAFVPGREPTPRPCVAAIGKINFHWRHKRLDYIAEIMSHLLGHCDCSIIGQGDGAGDFRKSLSEELMHAISWQPFVPPWQMPVLLRRVDAVFVLESALPHAVISNIALEALWSGVGIITDRNDFAGTYKDFVSIDENHLCTIAQDDSKAAADRIASWLGQRTRVSPPRRASFEDYVRENEGLYRDLSAREQPGA